jgi:hypothetical protein
LKVSAAFAGEVSVMQRGGDANIAPVPFELSESIRVWKAIFAKVLVGRKVFPPYTINYQRLPSGQRFYVTATVLANVVQAGRTRLW